MSVSMVGRTRRGGRCPPCLCLLLLLLLQEWRSRPHRQTSRVIGSSFLGSNQNNHSTWHSSQNANLESVLLWIPPILSILGSELYFLLFYSTPPEARAQQDDCTCSTLLAVNQIFKKILAVNKDCRETHQSIKFICLCNQQLVEKIVI